MPVPPIMNNNKVPGAGTGMKTSDTVSVALADANDCATGFALLISRTNNASVPKGSSVA